MIFYVYFDTTSSYAITDSFLLSIDAAASDSIFDLELVALITPCRYEYISSVACLA